MIILYDGTFEGFLSVIFDCYDQKLTPDDICRTDNFQNNMFSQTHFIYTHKEHSERVWKSWQSKLSKDLNQLPFLAFLSAEKDIEMHLYHFARMSFAGIGQVESNYSNEHILAVRKATRRVTQEARRLLQFVRFQLTADNIYFSALSPQYDVLPLCLKHFKNRFADQHWIVYDMKRDYGFYYNCSKVDEIVLTNKTFNVSDGKVQNNMLHEDEVQYQKLWANYCKNISISERVNLKCQKNHMPRRYWKFLTEKRLNID